MLNDLLNSQGCSDGRTSRNPIIAAVDQLLGSNAFQNFGSQVSFEREQEQGIFIDESYQNSTQFISPPPHHFVDTWVSEFSTGYGGQTNLPMDMMNNAWSDTALQYQVNLTPPIQQMETIWNDSSELTDNMMPKTAGETNNTNTVHSLENKSGNNLLDTAWNDCMTHGDHTEEDIDVHRLMAAEQSRLENMWKSASTEDIAAANSKLPTKEELEDAWHGVLTKLNEAGQEEYKFSTSETGTTNPFADNLESWSLANNFYRNGEINQAILALEATLQNDPENAEAWALLGTCHAENDDDRIAIICLMKARECDPYNLDALLALGTSYVNELNPIGAVDALQSWIIHNPRFQGLSIKRDEYSDGTAMDDAMQLMLEALEWVPNDPDVLVLLGVLYNVSRDYDSASECFMKALEQRPNDYCLWNKLGATLANSERSIEAIPYYAKALQARPSFVRGWLNLGISYANLNQYEDSANSYIMALRYNSNAEHIWGYLRTVFASMNRFDLVDICQYNPRNIDLLVATMSQGMSISSDMPPVNGHMIDAFESIY